MELASRPTRLLGQLVDGLVTVVPLVPAAAFFSISEGLGTFAVLGALLFSIVYYFFADALPGGQSLGKRMMGIAVVDRHSHAPCSPGQAFGRNFFLAVLGLFDWVFIFGEQRQRLGDMVAGTIVVVAPPAYRAGFA